MNTKSSGHSTMCYLVTFDASLNKQIGRGSQLTNTYDCSHPRTKLHANEFAWQAPHATTIFRSEHTFCDNNILTIILISHITRLSHFSEVYRRKKTYHETYLNLLVIRANQPHWISGVIATCDVGKLFYCLLYISPPFNVLPKPSIVIGSGNNTLMK